MSIFRRSKVKERERFDPKFILSDKSAWQLQEAYKELRTNLSFSMPGEGCKVIGITSDYPQSGKSINAINLAISFAQLGKKVLVLETDMRLPTVAKKLNIKGVPGLSDYLVGANSHDDVLQYVESSGIYVITAGTIPPDATYLIQSDGMERLMRVLRNVFDYIILDLPPVLAVSDPIIVSKYVDGYLFVVRDGQIDADDVGNALNKLQVANVKIFGFIYNGASKESEGKYNYKYKYKYKYSQ